MYMMKNRKSKQRRKGGGKKNKFCMIENAGGNNSGAGGGNPDVSGGDGGNTNPNQNSTQNQNPENNSGNFDNLLDNLWNEPAQNEPSVNNQSANTASQQQAQNQDPNEAFAAHVESLGLTAKLQNLDFNDSEAVQKAMQESIVETYRAAMVNANQLLDERVASLREEFEQKANTTVERNEMLNSLHKQLPFTKQPAFKPVAEAVFSRFLAQDGITTEQAIENTRLYFDKFKTELVGSDNNNNQNHQNGNLHQFPRGQNANQNANAATNIDDKFWENFIQGKSN